jgi:hypothetical protein
MNSHFLFYASVIKDNFCGQRTLQNVLIFNILIHFLRTKQNLKKAYGYKVILAVVCATIWNLSGQTEVEHRSVRYYLEFIWTH